VGGSLELALLGLDRLGRMVGALVCFEGFAARFRQGHHGGASQGKALDASLPEALLDRDKVFPQVRVVCKAHQALKAARLVGVEHQQRRKIGRLARLGEGGELSEAERLQPGASKTLRASPILESGAPHDRLPENGKCVFQHGKQKQESSKQKNLAFLVGFRKRIMPSTWGIQVRASHWYIAVLRAVYTLYIGVQNGQNSACWG